LTVDASRRRFIRWVLDAEWQAGHRGVCRMAFAFVGGPWKQPRPVLYMSQRLATLGPRTGRRAVAGERLIRISIVDSAAPSRQSARR
jgi:hypothetical protein